MAGVTSASGLFWMLFIHSYLHPGLSNLSNVISNDKKVFYHHLWYDFRFSSWIINTKEMRFHCFHGFICDFLEFSFGEIFQNFPKFSQHIASSGIQILNRKMVRIVKAVFRFLQICLLSLRKKTGLIDFPEKRGPTTVKCHIYRNFTQGNARIFSFSGFNFTTA